MNGGYQGLFFIARNISPKPICFDKTFIAEAMRFILVGSVLASSIHLLKYF